MKETAADRATSIIGDPRGKRVVVFGIGQHGGGRATIAWFLRHGATIVATDGKTKEELRTTLAKLPRTKRLTFVFGKPRLRDFTTADLVVQNPAIRHDAPALVAARNAGVPIVNEATVFFLRSRAPIIAVTGSKGKSSTSSLLAAMVARRFPKTVLAGNIRDTVMLDVVDGLGADARPVLELSSWQLEGLPIVRQSPHIAIVTNVLDDHLDRYDGKASYAEAKALIWRFQKKEDTVILNRDNAYTRSWASRVRSQLLWFSLKPFPRGDGAFLERGVLKVRTEGKTQTLLNASSLPVPGEHFVANVLAAALAAHVAGVPLVKIARAARTFAGVAGRLEYLRTVRGVRYYNDTTATAPAAAIAALRAFPKKPILIAGGTDKKLPYAALARAMAARARVIVLLPGTATAKMRTTLIALGRTWVDASSMDEAVRTAAAHAKRGDVVVLSPGAASFGLFRHEFHRGEMFVKAVNALARR